MSNVCIELAPLPPAGTPFFFKLAAQEIAAPEGAGTEKMAMWNVIGCYPVPINVDPAQLPAMLAEFPKNFAIAFSVFGDELPSVVHTAMALATRFGFPQPHRIAKPGDPIDTSIPNLSLFERPEQATQDPTKVQLGTGYRQPASSSLHNLPWFMEEVMKATGTFPAPLVAAPSRIEATIKTPVIATVTTSDVPEVAIEAQATPKVKVTAKAPPKRKVIKRKVKAKSVKAEAEATA